jgi:hypothetical protein
MRVAMFVLAVAITALAACTAAPIAAPSVSPAASTRPTVVATPAASGKGLWTAETGIHGTYFHYGNPPFGPPEFICGVGYNLSYAGGAPLVSADVTALFPDAFAAHVTPSMVDRAIGWQHPASMQINSPGIHDAAWLSRFGGAIGATCQNGPSDLDSLRGTILKVSWETIEGSYEQEFRVGEIRDEMSVCGTPDGRTRIVWTDPRTCF